MAKRKVYLILQLIALFTAFAAVNLQAITGIRARHCTGEKMDIRCDPGYRITINRVYFGLKYDRQCATGRRSYSEDCCMRTDRNDCVFFDMNIQDSVNTLCSGKNNCRPSARGIPARNKCRSPIFAETDRSDFKTVIYDCIPDDATVDLCSDAEKTAPSLYISSPQYPAPMRAGPSNCTCMAVSPQGVNAYALDFAFPDTDSVCEKELTFHEGTRNKVSYGCNRPMSAQRQMYRGREENLTISLLNNDADKGYAWIWLKPINPADQIRLYCGKALEEYLYGLQTTTTQEPKTTASPRPKTTMAPEIITTETTPEPSTTTTTEAPVSMTTTEESKSTTMAPPPTTEPRTTSGTTAMMTTTVTVSSTSETKGMETTTVKDSSTEKEMEMSSAEPEPEPEYTTPEPSPESAGQGHENTTYPEPEPEKHSTEKPINEEPGPTKCQFTKKCQRLITSLSSLGQSYFPNEGTLKNDCSNAKAVNNCIKKMADSCKEEELKQQERLMMATKAGIKIYCQDHMKGIIREQECFKRVAANTSRACQSFLAPPMSMGKFLDETEKEQCKRILDHQSCITDHVEESCQKSAHELALVIGEKIVRATIATENLVCSTEKGNVQGNVKEDDGSTGSSVHKTTLTGICILSALFILR